MPGFFALQDIASLQNEALRIAALIAAAECRDDWHLSDILRADLRKLNRHMRSVGLRAIRALLN